MPGTQIVIWFLTLLISLAACSRGMDTVQRQEGTLGHDSKPHPASPATPNPEAPNQASAPMPAAPEEGEPAEQKVIRLPPSAFLELPVAVIKQLEAQGCLIPQVAEIPGRHNVIRGQFARKGQMDWAVLCTKGGKFSILVFWGPSSPGTPPPSPGGKFSILVFWARPCRCPAELELEGDPTFFQDSGDEPIGYIRYINTVNADFILKHYKAYGGPVSPSLDHEGINAGFAGKGSDVYYCYRGKWLQLQGAD